jgi:hypothetical protein
MRKRPGGHLASLRPLLWCAPLGMAIWAAWSLLPTSSARPAAPQMVASGPDAVATAGELHPTAEWFDFLFGGFSQPREYRPMRPVRRPPPPRPKPPEEAYRTLCVRLCDGYYFPISFSTRRDRFAGDASRCERLCPTRSRLYVHKNPGQQIEDMRDLKGNPYLSLPTAMLYRTQYIADCTCRDDPANPAAPQQHNANADESAEPSATRKARRTR